MESAEFCIVVSDLLHDFFAKRGFMFFHSRAVLW